MTTQVSLATSDQQVFVVDKAVAQCSTLIKSTLEGLSDSDDQLVQLPDVSANVLKKVLEYCDHHQTEPLNGNHDRLGEHTTEIGEWDEKFFSVDQEMLFEIILAANYLGIPSLLDAGCKTVADMIKGKSPEEIRKLFDVVNDFTPEEEAQIRKENEWAEGL